MSITFMWLYSVGTAPVLIQQKTEQMKPVEDLILLIYLQNVTFLDWVCLRSKVDGF